MMEQKQNFPQRFSTIDKVIMELLHLTHINHYIDPTTYPIIPYNSSYNHWKDLAFGEFNSNLTDSFNKVKLLRANDNEDVIVRDLQVWKNETTIRNLMPSQTITFDQERRPFVGTELLVYISRFRYNHNVYSI